MVARVIKNGRSRLVVGLFTVFALLGAAAGGLQASGPKRVPLQIGTGQYTVRVVSKGVELGKGLSGTAVLPRNEGMLFMFGQDERWGIWMKDMRYPIDIIWLDQSKTVVEVVSDASPDSYPSTVFRPAVPARYVVELPAGSAAEASITVGDRAVFDATTLGGLRL